MFTHRKRDAPNGAPHAGRTLRRAHPERIPSHTGRDRTGTPPLGAELRRDQLFCGEPESGVTGATSEPGATSPSHTEPATRRGAEPALLRRPGGEENFPLKVYSAPPRRGCIQMAKLPTPAPSALPTPAPSPLPTPDSRLPTPDSRPQRTPDFRPQPTPAPHSRPTPECSRLPTPGPAHTLDSPLTLDSRPTPECSRLPARPTPSTPARLPSGPDSPLPARPTPSTGP